MMKSANAMAMVLQALIKEVHVVLDRHEWFLGEDNDLHMVDHPAGEEETEENEIYWKSAMSMREFFELCDSASEEEIFQIATNLTLNKCRKKRNGP